MVLDALPDEKKKKETKLVYALFASAYTNFLDSLMECQDELKEQLLAHRAEGAKRLGDVCSVRTEVKRRSRYVDQ